jgi:hypothetical protein
MIEMGGACNAHGEDEKYIPNFSRKTWRERDYLEDLNADGRIILQYILE